MPDNDITLQIVLEHMQNMQRVLMSEIGAVRTDLQRLERRVDRMETNLTNQIDAIDKRLDAIEIENLPKRVRVLEAAAGIA